MTLVVHGWSYNIDKIEETTTTPEQLTIMVYPIGMRPRQTLSLI